MAYFDRPLSSGPTSGSSGTISFINPALSLLRERQALLVTGKDQGVDVSTSLAFPTADFRELDVSFDPTHQALWCHMRPKGPPSFTPSLLGDLIGLRGSVQSYMNGRVAGDGLRYFIGASRLPGIFNLGGDLGYFVDTIRSRDKARLRAYAIDCCDVSYHMAIGFDTPVVTIGLVQGDALGGGFEGAMSFQILVAEKSARMGLPEVLFNLFPGMGAYSFLARKIGAAKAERMILSGKVYTASELHELGVVDVLAEDGQGEAEVRKLISGGDARYRLQQALTRVARRVSPLTFEELQDITDIWVDTAMQLSDVDLRKMERLALAQRRRLERS